MSFPVPIAYELNDEVNNTEVVYSDGRVWKGLPDIPGVRPGSIISYIEIMPSEDITYNNPLRIPYATDDSDNILLFLFPISPINIPEGDTVPWCSLTAAGDHTFTFGRATTPEGDISRNFIRAENDNRRFVMPTTTNVNIKGGIKYALIQVRYDLITEG